MDFGAQIKAWEDKANAAMNTGVCKAFESLGVDLVKLTGDMRVGGFSNGDMANNWHVSEGGATMVVPNGPDLSGTASLARIRALAKDQVFYKKDSVVFLTNVMGYAYRADVLGWKDVSQSTNGWRWSGTVGAYGFTTTAINNLKGKYF